MKSISVRLLALGLIFYLLPSCLIVVEKDSRKSKASITCEMCDTKMKVAAATKKKNGKTYSFCCSHCERDFEQKSKK